MTSPRNQALVACLLLMFCLPWPSWAVEGPPAGEYRVSGNDPGSDTAATYNGTLQLSNKGTTYSFQGVVDGQKYHGAGIYDTQCRILSIGFAGGKPEEHGVTVLKWDGATLKGHWLFLKKPDAKPGTEEWQPVK